MNTTGPYTRRARVSKLIALRARINEELATIEEEIRLELEATKRARAAAMLANVKVDRRTRAVCGSDAGYYRHLRTLKEPACDACKLAHRVYEAERAARKGNAA